MTKYCPFCGEELLDEAKFCKNCGKDVSAYAGFGDNVQGTNRYNVPVAKKSHTLATVAGFICAILIPLIGAIISIYLITRKDSPKAKRYGIIILVLSIVVWIISFITTLWMY